MRLFATYDQLDITVLAGAELLVRDLVRGESAARRNPKNPDYTGLDLMMESMVDESGAAVTSTFNDWLLNQQKAVAQVQKQGRLLREEQEAQSKRNNERNPKGPSTGGKSGTEEK